MADVLLHTVFNITEQKGLQDTAELLHHLFKQVPYLRVLKWAILVVLLFLDGIIVSLMTTQLSACNMILNNMVKMKADQTKFKEEIKPVCEGAN